MKTPIKNLSIRFLRRMAPFPSWFGGFFAYAVHLPVPFSLILNDWLTVNRGGTARPALAFLEGSIYTQAEMAALQGMQTKTEKHTLKLSGSLPSPPWHAYVYNLSGN